MRHKEKKRTVMLAVLAAGVLSAAAGVFLTAAICRQEQFTFLGTVCGKLIEKDPVLEEIVLESFKQSLSAEKTKENTNILRAYGYQASDFYRTNLWLIPWFAAGCLAGAAALGYFLWLFLEQREKEKLEEIAAYLEEVNLGKENLIWENEEGSYSKLKDEIYKTVTALHQTKQEALSARDHFAQNLSNIAHQLKTPITAISLSAQLIREPADETYQQQILQQLKRLTRLEEALLDLSRLEAGVLNFQCRTVDVFTLLTLAYENLEELFAAKGVQVEIPELGRAEFQGDLEWTMEAVMNLMKNCMEHTPKGSCVHCSYEENPLYTSIRIRDEGEGFSKEELFHLFERFYRGESPKTEGIGLGLALAKEIIEQQNGVIRAWNDPKGGACFEIRMYRH